MSFNRFFCISGIVFAGLNILDLILTLCFFEWEINPLVLNNSAMFVMVKYISTFIILSICIYKINEV